MTPGSGAEVPDDLPSCRTVDYSFDSLGRVSAITTTPSGGSAQSIVSSVTYHPFGGTKGFTFGNTQTYARTYDQDGRVSTYTLAGAGYTLTYDLAGRITFLTDPASPPNISMYDYDALDRLTEATVPSGGYEYTYDAVGNRLTKLLGSNTQT